MIYFYIVLWHCGPSCLHYLGYIGSCLKRGPRSVVLLARQLSEAAEFRNLGGNPTLPFVVLVEGKKFQDL